MKKRILKKKVIIPVMCVLVLVLLTVVAMIRMAGATVSMPKLESETVKNRSIKETLSASGTVTSLKSKSYFSPVDAPIRVFEKGVGDTVIAGEQLILFDTENLERDNQRADLNVRSGSLAYQDSVQQANQASSKVGQAHVDVANLEAAVAKKQGEINYVIAQIAAANQSAATDAKSAYETALKDYNQKLEVAKQAVKTAQETRQAVLELGMDQSSPEYNKAQTDLDNANAELTSLQNNPPSGISDGAADVSGLEVQLEIKQGELATLQSEYAAAKATIEAGDMGITQAALGQLQTTTNLAELEQKTVAELVEEGRKGISSDFAGIISDAKVVSGAMATQGMQLVTVSSTEEVCVNITVSKYDFNKVKEGQSAKITLADSTYNGTVKKISKIAQANDKGTPMIDVQVRIDNPDDNIFLGVEAKVTIQCKEVENVPSVSASVVNEDKSGSFCYIVKDGILAKQTVEKGARSEKYVEIKEGLNSGDEIVSDPGNLDVGDMVYKEGK